MGSFYLQKFGVCETSLTKRNVCSQWEGGGWGRGQADQQQRGARDEPDEGRECGQPGLQPRAAATPPLRHPTPVHPAPPLTTPSFPLPSAEGGERGRHPLPRLHEGRDGHAGQRHHRQEKGEHDRLGGEMNGISRLLSDISVLLSVDSTLQICNLNFRCSTVIVFLFSVERGYTGRVRLLGFITPEGYNINASAAANIISRGQKYYIYLSQ